jgi:hypothetical protein
MTEGTLDAADLLVSPAEAQINSGLPSSKSECIFVSRRNIMRTYPGRYSNQYSAAFAVIVILLIGLSCNIKSDDDWSRSLAHKKLSRASTSGSISDKVVFYFCPNGEYAMVTQFSGFSGGGAGTLSMADEDVELGRWSVRSGSLTVQPQNAESREYGLSQGTDQDVIQLNGNGYLVETHSECQ